MAYPLKPKCQTYAWGKDAQHSLVAQYMKTCDSTFSIDPAANYAELWMGTHAKGPSSIEVNGSNVSLATWIQENQASLGERVLGRWGVQLPFLFKVLSIRTALSIQAHPNKTLAEQLYATDPAHYPDDNHKPEMIIALTPMNAMCGFRPASEIAEFLRTVPQLRQAIGHACMAADEFERAVASGQDEEIRRALAACFRSLMTQTSAVVGECVASLVAAAEAVPHDQRSTTQQWILTLNSQYPGDVGCLCIFVLNVAQLSPGQALFLGPNIPHAYLDGDGIECMSRGDNVVRAGCTEKFRDVETLCSMLTYQYGAISQYVCLSGRNVAVEPRVSPSQPSVAVYDSPVEEFKVAIVTAKSGGDVRIDARDAPTIIIVTSGFGTLETSEASLSFSTGSVFFIEAGKALRIAATSDAQLFAAYC